MSKLTEILWFLAYADSERDEEKVKHVVAEAEQAILSYIAEVIGPDDEVYDTEVKRNNKSVRDYLRAEQRKRAGL